MLTGLFPVALDTPRAARRFLIETFEAWCIGGPLVDDASLVLTELATNALVHAHSPPKVKLSADRETVCVSVEDADPTLPTPRAPGALDCSGRGLAMVAALSERWGTERLERGKVVWAVLRR
jgi:anti-sigma regulatory factor (Ser/Thr protein kinase)